MAKIQQNYDIVISVDAGYNGSKVTVNGVCFAIPSDIVDMTGKTNFGDLTKHGFICMTDLEGQSHLVGEQARTLLTEKEYKSSQAAKQQMLESYDKFTMKESEIHLMTCVGMALIKWSEYCEENGITPKFDITKPVTEDSLFNIYIILGFPHDVYKKAYQAVKPTVVGQHNFRIETEENDYDLNFVIKSQNIMTFSQALAAFMGLVTDDNGKIDYDSEYFKHLPTLVIDGGQKTVGIYVITATLQIELAESNTIFAMNNVYEKVVQTIKDDCGRNDIEIYNIAEILKNNDGEIVSYNKDTDQTEVMDIKPIVNQFTDETCEQLIEYIKEKYNNLLDIKQIVVAGGTGAAYYEGISKYIKGHRSNLADHVILAQYKFMGKMISPVQAISVGLYKVLKNQIEVQKKEANREEK